MADHLKPVQKHSLADAVFEQLRDHIVSGEVAPGDVLPAERVLAEKLGVNRQAVREGLKRLEQAGLVNIRQGGGTRVLDFRRSGGLELLASMIVTPNGVHTGVARSVLEMRASLAPSIARACAERGGAEAGARLQVRIAEMRAAGDDLAQLQDLSLRFWGDVVTGSGNLAYQLAYNALDSTYRLIMHYLTKLLAPELTAIDRFQALADAVTAGDGDAAAAAATSIVALGTAAVEDVLGALDALEKQ
jgi:GntR family transcriptional regulator, transcriptional repressor for pyruvate dehydrogenase complex